MNYAKMDKVIRLCYGEIYKNAFPPADFNDLLENAPINTQGQKEIDFDNYEIKESTFIAIIDKICKSNRVTKKEKKSILVNLYLGATPRIVEKTLLEKRSFVLDKIKQSIKNNIVEIN